MRVYIYIVELSLSWLQTKVKKKYAKRMIFADDAVVADTAHHTYNL